MNIYCMAISVDLKSRHNVAVLLTLLTPSETEISGGLDFFETTLAKNHFLPI